MNKLDKLPFNLTHVAREYLRDHFNMDLEIPIIVNGRLTSHLGRFMVRYGEWGLESSRIEISKNLLVYHSEEDILDTLYHELIHYALFEMGLGYRDGDLVFESTLKELGVSSTGTTPTASPRHIYECPTCGDTYIKSGRRLSSNRYYVCIGKKGSGNFHEDAAMIYKGKEERPWREVDFREVI